MDSPEIFQKYFGAYEAEREYKGLEVATKREKMSV